MPASPTELRAVNIRRGAARIERLFVYRLAALFVLLALLAATATADQRSENLLINGNLITGDDVMPDGWRPSIGADCSAFKWLHPQGAPGELQISQQSKDVGGWMQTVALQPGWYELSGEARTENLTSSEHAVLQVTLGVATGMTFAHSADWEKLELFFKVDSPDPVTVECRMFPPPRIAAQTSFRTLRLVKLPGAPPAIGTRIDLGKVSRALGAVNPRPSPWFWLAPLPLIGIVACLFWVLLKPRETLPSDSATIANEPVRERRDKLGVALAMAAVLVLVLASGRIEFEPEAGFHLVTPAAVLSDEPYYVMVINSILFDHDLQLQDDFRRVHAGGLEAGIRLRASLLEGQTIRVNGRTGHHMLGEQQTPDFLLNHCDPRLDPKSPDVYDVSAHPIAWPALLALAIAPLHPAIGDVENETAVVLALISWLTALFTYLVARRDGMPRGTAIATVFILVGASPWLAYSRSFFPEVGIGLALIVCLWAWMREWPLTAIVAVIVATAFKPPMAVVAIGIIVDELRQGRRREAIKAGFALGIGVLAIAAFNYWLARTPLISGVEGWRTATDLHSLIGTLLEPREGLLIFVPWAIAAAVAIARGARSTSADSGMLRRMAIPLALYLIVVSSFGASAGLCYGPRYWVPFLPWMALAMVHAVRRAGRPAFLVCGALVLLAAAIAIPGALRYRHMFSKPMWLVWQATSQPAHSDEGL